ncbi:MAG: hypothetical protein P8049_12160 [Gemmatimonadota bacterium]
MRGSAAAAHASGSVRAGAMLHRPAITERWIRNATVANRIAFEQEMKRERRSTVDSRLKSFLKQAGARRA